MIEISECGPENNNDFISNSIMNVVKIYLKSVQ